MERFWTEELAEKGEKEASYGRAVYKSFKTRIIIGAIANLLYAFLSLANPVSSCTFVFLFSCTRMSVVRQKSGVYFSALHHINSVFHRVSSLERTK